MRLADSISGARLRSPSPSGEGSGGGLTPPLFDLHPTPPLPSEGREYATALTIGDAPRIDIRETEH
jgi:hypothetical protein